MSPKALEDIFSKIKGSSDVDLVYSAITDNQDDILSHPKEKIILTFEEFVSPAIVQRIRERLFIDFCDNFATECLIEHQGGTTRNKGLFFSKNKNIFFQCNLKQI